MEEKPRNIPQLVRQVLIQVLGVYGLSMVVGEREEREVVERVQERFFYASVLGSLIVGWSFLRVVRGYLGVGYLGVVWSPT